MHSSSQRKEGVPPSTPFPLQTSAVYARLIQSHYKLVNYSRVTANKGQAQCETTFKSELE